MMKYKNVENCGWWRRVFGMRVSSIYRCYAVRCHFFLLETSYTLSLVKLIILHLIYNNYIREYKYVHVII